MEILHIIPANGTYIIPLANMFQRCDKENTHTFLVTTVFQTIIQKNVDLLQLRGLQCMPIFKRNSRINKMRYLMKCAEKADHIVWHTFKTNDGYNPFLLFMNRKLLRKSTWIPGEGEIGNYMSVSNKHLNRYARRVNEYVRHHIACIGLEHSSDQKVLDECEINHCNAKALPYPHSMEQNEVLTACLQDEETSAKKKAIYVQVGLSSQAGNRHNRLLDILSNLSDYADSLAFVQFCSSLNQVRFEPGTKVNKNKIRKKAEKLDCRCIFKDKRLAPDNYIKSLRQMDVVLLGNDSSCQMHMVFTLLAMKKRIFMPQESPLFQYLDEMGANVYSLDQLLEAGSLAAAMELPGSNLPQQLQDYYSEAKAMEHWTQWYQSIKA